ncbi:hypothetical protein FHS72_001758 [Loktanella ponticola]|uniref:Uncharacterized protein n=1 Tax=Yoonia ponticola TaxID=1524255 RepID=A0A7W9BKD9_9RHOB|nr:hypothetical protein [Yoonia ponticola]
MVDFSTPKRRPNQGRTNSLFILSLCIIGLVAYAFVDSSIRPTSIDSASASQTLLGHTSN